MTQSFMPSNCLACMHSFFKWIEKEQMIQGVDIGIPLLIAKIIINKIRANIPKTKKFLLLIG
jgi:hypothetical protein